MSSCSGGVQRAHPALADLCLTGDRDQQLQSSENTQHHGRVTGETPRNPAWLLIQHLLQVSSVRRSVDRHVSCVFGHVGVGAVLQQQADDGGVSRRGSLVEDGRLVSRLGQHICPCGANERTLWTKSRQIKMFSCSADVRPAARLSPLSSRACTTSRWPP